jgi:hypothetical protein
MATATRWTIRQEPYDPDARDADNDGIVQEQTPWERPAGTNLVDELGRAITRGANAGQRPRGLRVVDRQGNTVDYTPTYEKPGGGFGGVGTSLAEAGAPSLRERGLPSLRELAAPRPVTQTEPSPEVTLPPAAVLPGTDAPEPPASRLDGGPKTSAEGTKEKIEKKNAEILGQIEEKGGTFARVNEAFVESDKEYGKARGLAAGLFTPKTPKDAAIRRREVSRQHLEAFQHVLRTGKAPTEEDGFLPWQVNRYKDVDAILSIYGNGLSEELYAHVRDTDIDELIEEIEQEVLKYHESLPAPRVRIPVNRLDGIFESGSYKTTHEVESRHSGEGFRMAYERNLGIPSDAPPELRPASGYVTHPDATDEARRLFRERNGREPTEFDQLDVLDGHVGIYGHVEVVLNPAIAGRTAYGRSDSLNNATRAARLDSTDKDEITNAVLGVGGKEADQVDPIGLMLNWQEARRTGSFGRVTDSFGWREEKSEAIVGINYTEALIAGSFDLDEVAEVRIYPEARNPMDLEASTTPILGYANGAKLKDAIHDEFYGTEALRRAGLSEEEIQYLQNNGLLKLDGQLKYHLGGDALMGLLEYRKAKDMEDKFKSAGIEKVTHIHPSGLDMMDPASYGDDSDLGDTPEAIRVARVRRDILSSAREAIERHKNPPARRRSSGPLL